VRRISKVRLVEVTSKGEPEGRSQMIHTGFEGRCSLGYADCGRS